jgi:hypothetical protein
MKVKGVADLIQIGLFVLLIGGSLAAALIWFRDEEVPAWAFAIMAAAFVVALPIGYVLGRRSWWRLRRDASERVRDERHVWPTWERRGVAPRRFRETAPLGSAGASGTRVSRPQHVARGAVIGLRTTTVRTPHRATAIG